MVFCLFSIHWVMPYKVGELLASRQGKFGRHQNIGLWRKWWNGYSFVGLPGFILAQKLKALKANLKKWNKEVFGDLAFRKKNLLADLMGLDAREELLGLSNEEQLCRIQLKGDIE